MEPKGIFNGFDLSTIEKNRRNMIVHALLGDNIALKELLHNDPGLANANWGYFTPIHFAVRSGHIDSIKLLLEHEADITKNPIGWSDDLITKAKDRGYKEIVDILEQHLAKSFQVTPGGSKLANLIKKGQKEIILHELDECPESVHAGDEHGNSPLHWAVLTRQIWLIDDLLQRGANIQAKRADGATPVHLSIHGDYWFRSNRDLSKQALRNEWFLAGYLIARGAEYDIWIAAAVGDSDHVESLLQSDPTLSNMKNSVCRRPLGYAARNGHTETVKLLLNWDADPNAEERDASRGSALWNAAAGNYEECAKLLLEHGADPNSIVEAGSNPLFIAMSNGHTSLVNLLYTYGASMNLDSACCLGRIDLVGEIIKANPALVNAGGDYGPLCMAAGYGHMDIVKMLIRSGADLNAPWYTNNYIGYALDQGPEMVKFLLESGADSNNANWLGVTYLHKAAWLGTIEFAQLLIDFGADVNVLDEEYNSTPLGWAAKYGHIEMVQFLLNIGANPHLPLDESWAQPLSWAKRKGYLDIVDMLEDIDFSALNDLT
ncbi:ankyrin repeat domain-containing protein [Bacillus sp. FSL K6-3431]|uniref:ankyrin repeat domain-containing protein n=1 Tax=Bacillus sp. FSL K6-3431 TaxID=2921500 RepID=UPI0030FB8ACA